MKKRLLAAAIVTATIAIAASLFVSTQWAGAQIVPLPALAPALLRWLAIVLIAAYATSPPSLTAWILAGLLAGAGFCHEWPSGAANLHVAGHVFRPLLKV